MKLSTIVLLVLLFSNAVWAEFVLESVDVVVNEIQPDGSVKVRENIKLIIKGEYSQALYDNGYSGYSNNDLSFWSTTTELKDVKRHINPAKTSIEDFTLSPQPRKKCSPVQEICHGELILEYCARPSYNTTNDKEVAIEGTGLFGTENYKPRTIKYTLNPEALSFTTTDQGNIILDENVKFIVRFPDGTVVTKANPLPEDVEGDTLGRMTELSWGDMVLVKFTLEFEVEKSLEEEVSEFFFGFVELIDSAATGVYGFAILILVVIIVGGYLYINAAKRRKEE